MSKKEYSSDYISGIEEAIKSIEITVNSGQPVTQSELDQLRNHWRSQPVAAPTKSEIDKFDAVSKAAHMRELNKATVSIEESISRINAGLIELEKKGLKLVN